MDEDKTQVQPADGELIRGYLEGDMKAFEQLYERYRKPVFAYIYSMTANASDAEDVFQDVFFRVIRSLDRYRHRDRFYSWVVRIAHNVLGDRWRQARRRGPAPQGDLAAGEELLPDPRPGPGARAAGREAGRAIEAAVRQLPPDQREVFVLRHMEGLSFREIAAIQRVPLNTALGRMHYALLKLRQRLSEYQP